MRGLLSLFIQSLSMKPIVGVWIFWIASIALFIAAVVGLRWGVQISIALLPLPQRSYADADMLKGVWRSRGVLLLLVSAACGIIGIFFSLQASGRKKR